MPTQFSKSRILIVDDDHDLGRALELYLERFGWEPYVCRSAPDVRTLTPLTLARFHYALIDHQVGDDSGLELVPLLLGANPVLRIVIMSGLPLEGEQNEVLERYNLRFLQKPFRPVDVISCLRAIPPRAASRW